MLKQQIIALTLITIVTSSSVIPTLTSYPQTISQGVPSAPQPLQPAAENNESSAATGRKYNVKPNVHKKMQQQYNTLEKSPIETNSINSVSNSPASGSGWFSNLLNSILQVLFGLANGANSMNKIDGSGTTLQDGDGFPWGNVITLGLRVVTAFLGGGNANGNDPIDKIDNGQSTIQGILTAVLSSFLGAEDPNHVAAMAKQTGEFINLVVGLLDALKTSFSQRSYVARSGGGRDALSDTAVASLTLLKGYIKSFGVTDDSCLQKNLCEANTECSIDAHEAGHLFCQLGTYAASYFIERRTGASFRSLEDAGRRGRSGEDCMQLYQRCNEV